MENGQAPPPAAVNKKVSSTSDAVKAQGILTSLTKKEANAAKFWQERWGFYSTIPKIQEEEALKNGMSQEEYKAAVESLNCQLEPKRYPVSVLPSPTPLPNTSSAMIGRRAQCSLEVFGRRLIKTARDIPTYPPLKPGQVYDPYKQTIVFLGIDCGDPISYKLPPSRCDISPEMMSRPLSPKVAQLSEETYLTAIQKYYKK